MDFHVDVSGWSGSEWQAVAAFIAVSVAIFIAGPIAFWQANEARKVRREQSRPYVIVDFEFRDIFIYLKIQNIGTTMAQDVRISFDRPLTSTLPNSAVPRSRIFHQPVPMIAPGRRISLLFDRYPDRSGRSDEFSMQYLVTIQYRDTVGRLHKDPPYPLDLATYDESSLEPKGLPDLVSELKKVREQMEKWSRGPFGQLIVYSSSYDRYTSREIRPLHLNRFKKVVNEEGLRAAISSVLARKLRQYGWRE